MITKIVGGGQASKYGKAFGLISVQGEQRTIIFEKCNSFSGSVQGKGNMFFASDHGFRIF